MALEGAIKQDQLAWALMAKLNDVIVVMCRIQDFGRELCVFKMSHQAPTNNATSLSGSTAK